MQLIDKQVYSEVGGTAMLGGLKQMEFDTFIWFPKII